MKSNESGRRDSANYPFHALFEHGDIEVDEQSKMQVGKFQISQQLALVNGQQPVDRLEFEDDTFLYEQIEA